MQQYLRELRAIVALGAPLAFMQVGTFLLPAIDMIMLGRIGEAPVAAVILATVCVQLLFVFCFGVLAAITTLYSQAFGVGRATQMQTIITAGWWITVWLSLLTMAVLLLIKPLLMPLGVDRQALDDAQRYLYYFLPTCPLVLLAHLLRSVISAMHRTAPLTVMIIVQLASNVLLNWVLIYGNMGLPALGLVGAAIATTLSAAIALVVLWIGYERIRLPAHLSFFRTIKMPMDRDMFQRLWRMGLPIGLGLVVEVGLFTFAGITAGRISVTTLAAHGIAMQAIGLLFMALLGCAFAVTIRVGHAVGQGNMAAARLTGNSGLLLGVGYMLLCGVLLFTFADEIVWLFIDADRLDDLSLVAMAATFLRIGILFEVGDAMQLLSVAALRGAGDVVVTTINACIAFVIVGMTLVEVFAIRLGFAGNGIWYALVIALWLAGILQYLRWRYYAKHMLAI